MKMQETIDRLFQTGGLPDESLRELIELEDLEAEEYLFQQADKRRREYYGNEVFTRGLIEFTNYCRNDCYYCGIRRSNLAADRYRLTKEDILACCSEGYELGYRTFVLQGGEDGYFTDSLIADIVSDIRRDFPDCAITLSIGERSRESYQAFFAAGADRYLLRHETANKDHYGRLHPSEMSLEHRLQCLQELKRIGYQVGAGFMVGSPYQTTECILDDLRFLQSFKPAMVGIGPFISHKDTPFASYSNGSLHLTLRLLAIIRLMLPYVLLPATTALGTIDPMGRELGLKAGANVVMPNLSPVATRKLYELYDNKICTGEESAQCRGCLAKRVEAVGYQLTVSRGDVKNIKKSLDKYD